MERGRYQPHQSLMTKTASTRSKYRPAIAIDTTINQCKILAIKCFIKWCYSLNANRSAAHWDRWLFKIFGQRGSWWIFRKNQSLPKHAHTRNLMEDRSPPNSSNQFTNYRKMRPPRTIRVHFASCLWIHRTRWLDLQSAQWIQILCRSRQCLTLLEEYS